MNYGIIGAGNMGGTMACVLATAGNSIMVCDHHPEKLQALEEEIGARVATVEEITAKCDAIVLAVKPQVFPALLAEMAPLVQKRVVAGESFVVITLAAGIRTPAIATALGADVPMIRIMPNTPLMIGKGMTGLCVAGFADVAPESEAAAIRTGFAEALSVAGEVVEVTEADMDAVVAVSGSGPAFVYSFIDAMTKGGMSCGLTEDVACALAVQTVIGAAEMVRQSPEDPGTLAQRVCSPGGTTIEGMKALQNGAFDATVQEAIKATCRRSVELSQ